MEHKRMKPCNNTSSVLRKGAWTAEEDMLLKNYIQKYGEGKWHMVPLKAGLNRCRKSCRLRWLNYLRPDIKRGDFGEDEIDLMHRLHKLLGNRWSLIAGRIPGRTANDVKNYWNTHVRSRPKQHKEVKDSQRSQQAMGTIIRPQPRTLSKTLNTYPHIKPHNTSNLITSSYDGFANVLDNSEGLVSSPRVYENKVHEYLDELFEDYGGPNVEGRGLDVEQQHGQNSLFDFSIDDAIWDLLDS